MYNIHVLGGVMGKIYVNENQLLLQELIKVYRPEKYDWLCGCEEFTSFV